MRVDEVRICFTREHLAPDHRHQCTQNQPGDNLQAGIFYPAIGNSLSTPYPYRRVAALRRELGQEHFAFENSAR
jgi:hypothetical protein